MRNSVLLATFITFAGLTACNQTTAQTEPVPVTTTSSQTLTSISDFETTKTRLKNAIESRGLTLFTTVDHAAGAAKVDKALAPNTLYIFGNPNAGTPLMQAHPAFGIALPLKAHVYERDGNVYVAVSDIRGLTSTAGISEPAPVINKIAETLSAIQSEAVGA